MQASTIPTTPGEGTRVARIASHQSDFVQFDVPPFPAPPTHKPIPGGVVTGRDSSELFVGPTHLPSLTGLEDVWGN